MKSIANTFFENQYILFAQEAYFFLSSTCYAYKKFDKFSNSFEVVQTDEHIRVFNLNDLAIMRPFEIKYIEERFYVLSDSLDIYKTMIAINNEN